MFKTETNELAEEKEVEFPLKKQFFSLKLNGKLKFYKVYVTEIKFND